MISADDHVIEPAHVWQDHLPPRVRAAGPRLVRKRGYVDWQRRTWMLAGDESGEWADCWSYDGQLFPIVRTLGAISFPRDIDLKGAVCFEELRPGCYDQTARLADMDANQTEASICFPTFPRFCGQTFLEASDHEVAAACVRAYNDWMIDDWCAGDAYGRLIPLTLVTMWDAEMAAAEVRRCAAKGSHAICFSESPADLGVPSLHSGFWEPLWQACEDTATVVNIHQGSSSTFMTTSRDAPSLVPVSLNHVSAERATADWLSSGILERYPTIKLVLSEGQAGWMPFLLERMDRTYDLWGRNARAPISRRPSTYVPGRVYVTIIEEHTGLGMRDRIGMGQIMFEIDYPHADSTWPDSLSVAEHMVKTAGLDEDETRGFLRGNVIECYGLERFGLRA
jgi:predicted TIM-barrel fold metal-dependent hydrolase